MLIVSDWLTLVQPALVILVPLSNPCQTPSFVYYCETGANSAPNGAWFFVPVVSQQHPAAVCWCRGFLLCSSPQLAMVYQDTRWDHHWRHGSRHQWRGYTQLQVIELVVYWIMCLYVIPVVCMCICISSACMGTVFSSVYSVVCACNMYTCTMWVLFIVGNRDCSNIRTICTESSCDNGFSVMHQFGQT